MINIREEEENEQVMNSMNWNRQGYMSMLPWKKISPGKLCVLSIIFVRRKILAGILEEKLNFLSCCPTE